MLSSGASKSACNSATMRRASSSLQQPAVSRSTTRRRASMSAGSGANGSKAALGWLIVLVVRIIVFCRRSTHSIADPPFRQSDHNADDAVPNPNVREKAHVQTFMRCGPAPASPRPRIRRPAECPPAPSPGTRPESLRTARWRAIGAIGWKPAPLSEGIGSKRGGTQCRRESGAADDGRDARTTQGREVSRTAEDRRDFYTTQSA